MGTPSFTPWRDCGGDHPPDEQLVLSTAQALRETGLAAKGYTLLELDDGWPAAQREPITGAILANATLFPSGMANLSSALDAMDPPLRLGLYTCRGSKTCGGKPGSEGHEAQDARSYIRWGIRQVKSDSCFAPDEHRTALEQYGLMQKALSLAPPERSVFFSLCGWFNYYAAAGPRMGVGQAYRVAADCIGFEQMLLSLDNVAPVAALLDGAHYPDMDMMSRDATRDDDSKRPDERTQLKRLQTQFALIAVTGAVLLLSFDVRDQRNAALIELVSNEEVLAVHQDVPLHAGYTRRLLGGALAKSIQALHTNLSCAAGGGASRWTFHANSSVHGRFESVERPGWCLQASTGNGPAKCGDGIFINASMASLMPCSQFVLGAHCGAIGEWIMEPAVLGPTGGRIVSVYAESAGESSSAITRDEDGIAGALWIQRNFSDGDALAPLQRWRWDAGARQLLNSEGGCLGVEAAAPQRVNVWARQLSSGDFALVFVNAEPGDATLRVTCEWITCLSWLPGLAADTRLAVRDVLQRADLPPIVAGNGVESDVEANGGSRMLRLAIVSSAAERD